MCGAVSALRFSPPPSLAPRRAAATPRRRPASGPSTTAATTSSTPSTSTTIEVVAPTTTATTEVPPTPTVATDAPTTTVTTVVRPTATIDELVGAEGARVHVRCVGEGDTTVVLIAGFGGDTTGWANVEPAIAASARVCSYDRPGTGTSDPATGTATFTTEATDLHDLLGTIGEPGPYVVVGQSFGGSRSSHVRCDVRRRGQRTRSCPRLPHHLARRPLLRARRRDRGRRHRDRRLRAPLPPKGYSERLEVVAAFDEVSNVVSLGSLPMAVLTALDRELPAGLAASEVARLTEAWNQGQHSMGGAFAQRERSDGRRHRPPHRDRPTGCRDRRDHPAAPVTRTHQPKPHQHTQGVIMHGRPTTQSIGDSHASHPNRWRILGVLVLALLVTSIDHTIINVAMPSLVGDLGASSAQLQWIVASYTIVFAGLLLTAGSVGDRFGRRHALLAGLATFLGGSIVAATAGRRLRSSPAAA